MIDSLTDEDGDRHVDVVSRETFTLSPCLFRLVPSQREKKNISQEDEVRGPQEHRRYLKGT